MTLDETYFIAAASIAKADTLIIGAGAGMGVDSGLPDFRGTEGFWKAYPPFRGRHFSEMSTPHWFRTDPHLAWGFFGHRLKLYRETQPHAGFEILRHWAEQKSHGAFVFTSNVDGQFQKARFEEDRLVECHGSIHHLQCSRVCTDEIWWVEDLEIVVNHETIRAESGLPLCRRCGEIARPNILMFNDPTWIPDRTAEQFVRWKRWLREMRGYRVVTIEIGAGHAVPTVRTTCESQRGTLIRINPRDYEVPEGGLSIVAGALEALVAITQR